MKVCELLALWVSLALIFGIGQWASPAPTETEACVMLPFTTHELTSMGAITTGSSRIKEIRCGEGLICQDAGDGIVTIDVRPPCESRLVAICWHAPPRGQSEFEIEACRHAAECVP